MVSVSQSVTKCLAQTGLPQAESTFLKSSITSHWTWDAAVLKYSRVFEDISLALNLVLKKCSQSVVKVKVNIRVRKGCDYGWDDGKSPINECRTRVFSSLLCNSRSSELWLL